MSWVHLSDTLIIEFHLQVILAESDCTVLLSPRWTVHLGCDLTLSANGYPIVDSYIISL